MLREMELKLSSDSPILIESPNAIGNVKRQSIFVIAAMSGEIELIRFWLGDNQTASRRSLPVTQENINEGFRAAVVRGHLSVVECLLTRIDTIKHECSARAGSALTLAAQLGKPEIVKAICGQRLMVFITETSRQPMISRYGLYSSLNEPDMRAADLEAANAIWKLLNDKASYDEVLRQFSAVRQGKLAVLLSLIKKYYLDYQIKVTVGEATPLVTQPKVGKPGCISGACTLL